MTDKAPPEATTPPEAPAAPDERDARNEPRPDSRTLADLAGEEFVVGGGESGSPTGNAATMDFAAAARDRARKLAIEALAAGLAAAAAANREANEKPRPAPQPVAKPALPPIPNPGPYAVRHAPAGKHAPPPAAEPAESTPPFTKPDPGRRRLEAAPPPQLEPRTPEAHEQRASELDRLHRDMPVQRYRSLVGHWLARWFRAPRPATPEPVPDVAPGQLAITFGGHATVIARYHQLGIAFDPMLGRWIGGVRRAVEPGLLPDDFREIGLVLISHRHADHLHLPTLRRLPRSATAVVPPGAAGALSRLGFARVVELAPDADLEMRGVQITACATSHGDGDLARGVSYMVRGDGPSVFLCGDSGYFTGFAEIGERFAPDIALLPIGGFVPASFRERHMSPLDALYAFEDLRARVLVPIHHGAFALSYEQLDEPARWLVELARTRNVRPHVIVMAAGQSERFVAPNASVDIDV